MTGLGAAVALSAIAASAAGPVPTPRAQLRELESILASRNDNDPRLDRDFNALSPEAKRLFRERYAQFARERRNERGTVVYLLGKNLTSPEDWTFLRLVVAEPPCLSLADCSKKTAGPWGPGEEVTLAYPALVALEQAQRVLEESRRAKALPPKGALAVVEAGFGSKAPAVHRLAAKIQASLGPKSHAVIGPKPHAQTGQNR